MSRYRSIGTLRYSLSTDDGRETVKVIFIPTEDYSVKYNGKSFAILVTDDSVAGDLDGQLKEYKPEKHIGIDLHVGSDLALIVSAVLQAAKDQTRVEIEIESDKAYGFSLVGLTIPAK